MRGGAAIGHNKEGCKVIESVSARSVENLGGRFGPTYM